MYDFAIHWFDIVTCFIGERRPRWVYAPMTRGPTQQVRPDLFAQAMIEYEGEQASLAFDADTRFGAQDHTFVNGSGGTITSVGTTSRDQTVTLHRSAGQSTPKLSGRWFPDGFHGTMGELLCAIEEGREPDHGARNNLRSAA